MRAAILVFLLLVSEHSFADADSPSSLVVAAAYWDGFTNRDNTGVYYELIDAIYHDYDIDYLTSTYPRALNQFKAEQADIMIGVYKHELPSATFASWFLDTDMPVQLFYRANEEPQDVSIEGLIDKKVAWRRGYGFEQFFPSQSEPYLFDDMDTSIKLLLNDRIDYIVDYEHNFNQAYKDKVEYKVIHSGGRLYLAFQNTKKGKKLATLFDKKMPTLRNNGVLKKLFGESYARSGLNKFMPDNVVNK